ncbi:hypothetical protein GCM10009706_14540 [Curtobacterium citreum]|uniref:Uncharacterized protein n=1 Tax=Curtobacterium citreum TaxID=2036 RepID=A0ABT2HDH4_9MICO|nr:hypothetical protein [Curtobacterium citreum]MCS6521320.1 hypothetical protein [Curtobacterium citreum]TQJ28177.1 hypothetical protein FB462_2057 [Curtobacterium citreum]GGL77163.1 hypothetical protein GCM10009706_14540 [Curtobacterium citreum]
MKSIYRIIIGGAEIALDPNQAWDDKQLRDHLASPTPVTLKTADAGTVTFIPGPGIAIVRELLL